MDKDQKIRIGISSCLLGNKVRYDGGHQHDRYLTRTLGDYFDYVPVCPEVECGLPTPREAMRLVGDPESPRLVTRKTGIDHTDRMLTWAAKRVKELENDQLCGFIFKSKSPSSGMERVKVYDDKSNPRNVGVGLFAAAFKRNFPLLPTEEEGRLHDQRLRENFIESVFVLKRWRDTRKKPSPAKIVRFHTEHKLLLRSHSEAHYRQLGKLVANVGKQDLQTFLPKYEEQLMEAMRLKATTKKHTNILMHCLGHFKKDLTSGEKAEFLEILDEFKAGYLPLIVPITLMNHFVRKYDEQYLQSQHYLNPHPIELKLRNHA
ncbi:MAG: DUF1722 domain-containing protein [Desulfobulbaceae bacterium]|nr:MAG: DUF1722 domain-containing protein [Desulfobulbaceae bacterium]